MPPSNPDRWTNFRVMPPLTADLLELLIAAFGREVGEPTADLGRARCISRRSFSQIWKRIKNAHPPLEKSGLSANDALSSLIEADLLTEVRGTGGPAGPVWDTLYMVGWGVTLADLDPLELLTALEPSGVVCYFSAFALHGLTTQVPTQHHVARLVERPLPTRAVPATRRTAGSRRLGTLRAQVNGVPYYSTQRTAQLVAGVQRRTLAPWLVVRCTTVAQTLIDGVLRSYCCGGPSVVIEAWEQAAEVTSAETLIELAEQIGHPPVSRRVGYMIETVAGFRDTVSPARLERLYPAGQDAPPIPLFPGFTPRTTNDRWQLQVP